MRLELADELALLLGLRSQLLLMIPGRLQCQLILRTGSLELCVFRLQTPALGRQ